MDVEVTESKIISIGGVNTRRKVVEVFSNNDSPIKTCFDLPIECHCDWSVSLKLGGWVYIVGGLTIQDDRLVDSNEVFRTRIDSDDDVVQEIASLNEGRSAFGATIFEDALFVAGGCREGEPLSSVECYLQQTNEWKALASTKIKKYANVLVSCKGSLYDIGGMDGDNYYSLMHCLSGLPKEWEDAPSMHTPRAGHVAVSLNECIYVIGGRTGDDDTSRTNTVEKYDPLRSKWDFVKEMNYPRDGHAACLLNGKIYVVGGINPEDDYVHQIECYDSHFDDWSVVGEARYDLWAHTLITI